MRIKCESNLNELDKSNGTMEVDVQSRPISGVINQVLATILSKYIRVLTLLLRIEILMVMCIVNIGVMGQGCAIGWTSPALPILKSQDTHLLYGPLSEDEAAWVGSILPLAALIGTLVFGIFSNFVGSKRALICCGLPGIVN